MFFPGKPVLPALPIISAQIILVRFFEETTNSNISYYSTLHVALRLRRVRPMWVGGGGFAV
jgi:hypothetical protein